MFGTADDPPLPTLSELSAAWDSVGNGGTRIMPEPDAVAAVAHPTSHYSANTYSMEAGAMFLISGARP